MSGRPKQRSIGWKGFGCAGVAFLFVAVVAVGMRIDYPTFDMSGLLNFDVTNDADPGKGTESARLPLEVSPRTGLTDGTVVTVRSDAFEKSSVVGVAACLAEAETDARGVDACDEIQGARYAVDPQGKLRATFPVPRVITIRGVAHDCAASETSCLVVAADANDYDRSGGQPISFRTDLGAADLTPITVRAESDLLPVIPPDAGALAARAPVEVTASGFQPGEPVLMAYCAEFPRQSIRSCDAVDDSVAITVVMLRTVRGVTDTADDTGTVTFRFHALPSIEPTYPADAGAPTDCSVPSAQCSFVIAAAADTKRSAVVPYSVSD